MPNSLTVSLGLQGELVITLPSGRELSLQRDTAEATIRRLLTPPPTTPCVRDSSLPAYDSSQIKRFTKSGRPLHPNLTLEDLDL